MGWGDVLAAVGGGLKGIEGVQTHDENLALEHEKMANAVKIADMRAEVQAMIASMNEGGRNDRWGTPSGNTVATVQGANTRAAATDATTRRGQDVNLNLGTMRDATTRRGQDTTAGTARMRDTTTRRGQDISSSDQRRGQDLGDTHYWDESGRLYEGMRLGDARSRERNQISAYGHAVTAGRANASGLGLDTTPPVPGFGDWLKEPGNNIFAPAPADTPPAVQSPAGADRQAPAAAQTPAAPPARRPAAAPAAAAPLTKPIPSIPGGMAESTDGGKTWHRVK